MHLHDVTTRPTDLVLHTTNIHSAVKSNILTKKRTCCFQTIPATLSLLAVMHCMLVSPVRGAPGDILVESAFFRDADGWYATWDGKLVGNPIQLDVDRVTQRIKGVDKGNVYWYFTAPAKFLGDKRAFMNGVLQYNFGHYFFNGELKNNSKQADVIIESKKKKIQLGARYVYTGDSMNRVYNVTFSAEPFQKFCKSGSSSSVCAGMNDRCQTNEDCCDRNCVGGPARWYNLKTGKPAQNFEILQVLTSLSGLKIRAGYYDGVEERSWLKNPLVLEGGLAPLSPPSEQSANVQQTIGTATCSAELKSRLTVRPAVATTTFNTDLIRPWLEYIEFPSIPQICSDASLVIEASGDLLGEDKYVSVYGEKGEELGRLFVTANDFSVTASACGNDGSGECSNIPNVNSTNASIFMKDEVVEPYVVTDGVVVPRSLMSVYSADRRLKIGLGVAASNLATTVRLVSATIEFSVGGCYSYSAVRFPGIARAPDRTSGYFETLSIPKVIPAADDGAITMNATGVLQPVNTWVGVYINSSASSPGSPSSLVAMLFAGAGQVLGSGPVRSVTEFETSRISRSNFLLMAQATAAQFHARTKIDVFLRGEPDASGHPDQLVLNEASILYPPLSCSVTSLKEGMGVLGLMGRPIERELQYCDDWWECSAVGPANKRKFISVAKCRTECWSFSSMSASPGVCYQPFIADGTCANPAEACVCSIEGRASCVAGQARKQADGTCYCRSSKSCIRSPINASYPFSISTKGIPASDVTIFVEATVPFPFRSDNWLRVRLGEGDMRTLGHLFGSPDCSWQCRDSYDGYDSTKPIIDSVRLPFELARDVLSDNLLEILIEIDEPRQALSCALHPQHPRCFPYLDAAQNINSSQTSIEVLNASVAGIDQTTICRDCESFYVLVESELMQVVAYEGNSLQVVRGVGNSVLQAHSIGSCFCSNHNTTCEGSLSEVDCTTYGGSWQGTVVQPIYPYILPALANEGQYILRSITVSYGALDNNRF
ncbi:hypothetical protein GUITHDRAFT_101858 [Guillardia theta CCMP2712]|uniref:Laminin IV type A domain-containing protein n=1 Tax=Guillardia theta (strain CCMP2712) TaxID=905079 RepID=L1JWV9_GUITC|nr:hypothetical protein GUITHDRAFT_101858 [Guillardia theta CCMP2712]EKX52700.1 hypothetical protein GUITHDRAFT_101858 [Guillardia theta CCMP2712]|eukprot:XP_005839680.1 hypothetical protein GUITHDRAFT_101858 [Guillardia theta CCMP2712]